MSTLGDKQPVALDSKIEVVEPKFEITVMLSDKYWNEDLKRYIFSYTGDGVVMVSETNEITFEASDMWRISDMLYSSKVEGVIIKRIK